MFENDLVYKEFLEFLADLSLNADSFEIALAALRLQTELTQFYGKPY